MPLHNGEPAALYASLFDEQMGRCAICGTIAPLVIDHDHTTGFVRGLLCHNCNVGLGAFRDSVADLRNAADYLDRAATAERHIAYRGATGRNTTGRRRPNHAGALSFRAAEKRWEARLSHGGRRHSVYAPTRQEAIAKLERLRATLTTMDQMTPNGDLPLDCRQRPHRETAEREEAGA